MADVSAIAGYALAAYLGVLFGALGMIMGINHIEKRERHKLDSSNGR